MNLNKLTVQELRAKCKELNLKRYSKMRKRELVALLQQKETQRELQDGTALMEKINEFPDLDSIAAIGSLNYHPHHSHRDEEEEEEKEPSRREGRGFLGNRGYCLDCGCLEVAVSGRDDWCAECGSSNLALKTPLLCDLIEARKAVDAALFGKPEHFDSNYQTAIMAVERLARPRRVKATRRVAA